MNLIIEGVLLIVGYIIGTWLASSVILPLIYGFPRSLIGYFRKELKIKAALSSLGLFIGWNVGLILLFTIIESFFPTLLDFLFNSMGFALGSFIGFWLSILSLIFSKNSRELLAKDFKEWSRPYRLTKTE